MTCKQCKYEFCWLCMGDYRNHSFETGRGLCNSLDDVVKSGRDKKDEVSDAERAQMELKKIQFYTERFIAHQNAIVFAQKQVQKINQEIM